MAKSKKALGRGLGELFGEITQAYENEIPNDHEASLLPIVEIQTNPYQPRKHFNEAALKELAASIKAHGLLQPIVVTKELDGYTLIAGERRLRACKMANLTHINATILDIDISKFHELALIENIQREELNPIELAQSYEALLEEHDMTHDELSSILHKSRTQITNTLRLLALNEAVQEALVEKKITQGHAKVLLGVEDKDQKRILDSIIGQKLSVRDVERMAKDYKTGNTLPKKEAHKSDESLDFSALKRFFNAHSVEYKTASQSITIAFDSQESVEELANILLFNKDLSK